MTPSPPFIDPASGELHTEQILSEAFPLAGLILLFGGLALLPLLVVFLLGGGTVLAAVFTALAQFVLAVGTGIVLIYVIARGIQLANGDG